MRDINTFIQSGILESYVLGLASNDEIMEIEAMSNISCEIEQAIDNFCNALETNGLINSVPPPLTVKTMVMASIDFMERLNGGEPLSFPPTLNNASKIIDFSLYLNRPDMVPPSDFEDVYAKIIGYSPQMTTAIVWIKAMAPQEIHTDEYEHFLIVEGTCYITIGDEVSYLVANDYLSIPLFQKHHVVVTSKIPCKAILQRIAA